MKCNEFFVFSGANSLDFTSAGQYQGGKGQAQSAISSGTSFYIGVAKDKLYN